jgi:hypothetical protein
MSNRSRYAAIILVILGLILVIGSIVLFVFGAKFIESGVKQVKNISVIN